MPDSNIDGNYYCSAVSAYRYLWDCINTRKGTRWDDNPEVWVLTFEIVQDRCE